MTDPAAALEPDRNQLEIFVEALFRYAGNEGYASIRSFFDDSKVFRISTSHANRRLAAFDRRRRRRRAPRRELSQAGHVLPADRNVQRT